MEVTGTTLNMTLKLCVVFKFEKCEPLLWFFLCSNNIAYAPELYLTFGLKAITINYERNWRENCMDFCKR